MIDFKQVWLPQILGYARLIANDDALRSAWLTNATIDTSVTSPDELIEQVFDDLDSDTIAKEASRHLIAAPHLAEALQGFLTAMRNWEAEWDPGNISPTADEQLFKKPKWTLLKQQAERVLTEAKLADI
jgi:hypothetical protein